MAKEAVSTDPFKQPTVRRSLTTDRRNKETLGWDGIEPIGPWKNEFQIHGAAHKRTNGRRELGFKVCEKQSMRSDVKPDRLAFNVCQHTDYDLLLPLTIGHLSCHFIHSNP